MMRRFGALLVTLALISLALVAQGWTIEDCVEVNWDHPDCDQYPTTTVPTTTTTEATTTTQPEVTTTTGQTTTTQPETTTTRPETTETTQPPPTTTVTQCPPGTVHQPPLCVTTTIPHFDTTTTAAVGIGTPLTIERLPETGVSVDPAMLGALASLTLGLGLVALGRSGRKREG